MTSEVTIEELQKTVDTKVNPLLMSHLGGAVVTAVEDNIAYIKLTGECAGCSAAAYTLEDIIKKEVLKEHGDLDDVRLDDSISPELIAMAKKILKKN